MMRTIARWALFAAIVTATGGGIMGMSSDGISVGDRAEEFTLNDVRNGHRVSLSDFGDAKAVAVIFIGTQCPYSNAYNHVMANLATQYQAKGIVVLGINSNRTEPIDSVRAHADGHGLSFTVLKDEGGQVAARFGASVTSEAFLLDPSRNVVYHGALGNSRQPSTDPGKADAAELAAALDSFLAGEPIARPTTKMFGCSIKR